jgi:anti-sigma factor RsiW
MMSEAHVSLEQLSALAAGERGVDVEDGRQQHLDSCPLCSRRYAQMQRIDRALRHLPIPAVGGAFTATVLRRVARTARTPLAFRLLEHGASVFGILFVVAAILSAYLAAEASSVGQQGDGPVGNVVREGGTLISLGGRWIVQHSGSFLGDGSGVLLMLGLVAVGMIFLFDRWLSARMEHR